MIMKIRMKLISDVVFGNGISIPGGENISILCDKYGFPYYKGGTFKGIFREELIRFLGWKGISCTEIDQRADSLLGKSGSDKKDEDCRLTFSDFTLSSTVKERILEEIGMDRPELVTDSLSHLRAFTRLDEEGMAKKGSLRICRCVNKNLIFYSEISCAEEDMELIQNILQLIKWVGSMRNRGFGKVKISVI